MSGTRLNSEKKIENDIFKIKMGTTNKIVPKVIYIEGRAFISPNTEEDEYSKPISEIKHHFKQCISRTIRESNSFENSYILDFQVASNGISVGKKSFLSFEIFLRQQGEELKKLSELKVAAEPLITTLVNSLNETIISHDFSVSKTKK